MVSLKFLCSILEKLGYIDFRRSESLLKRVFCIFQNSLIICYPSLLFLSTVTRSQRYAPELLQMITEVIMMLTLTFATIYLGLQHRKLGFLIHYMETKFSKANPEILAACDHKARLVFNVTLFLGVCVGLGSFVEVMLPMSEAELEIHRRVYRTKHPERRLLYKIKVPFIDESESWAFGIIFGIESYLFVMFCFMFAIAATFVPIVLIHLRGQFDILCSFVLKIGGDHRDNLGRRIRYTSIERNEFALEENYSLENLQKNSNDVGAMGRLRVRKVAEKVLEEAKYQKTYIRQIVVFHQMLIKFQEEVSANIS